eukprot:CFRG0333T1
MSSPMSDKEREAAGFPPQDQREIPMYPPVYPPPEQAPPLYAYPPSYPPPPGEASVPYPVAYPEQNDGVPSYNQHWEQSQKKPDGSSQAPQAVHTPEHAPPGYTTATDADNKSFSSYPNDVPWGMEPSSEEMQQRFESTGKGKMAILTGTNTVRCMGCGQNCVYKDATVKFIRCPRCKNWTPRKGAKPMECDKYEFIHCGGQCSVLMLVPKGTKKFMCPRERVLCTPKKKMGMQR